MNLFADNYGFELETGDRTWVFVPDSQEDMDKWITCLEKIVKQVNRTPLVGTVLKIM